MNWTAAAALLTLAAGSAQAALRVPLPDDVRRCAANTMGNETLTGNIRLELMIRRDGTLYAAYIHSTHNVDDRRLQRCLTNQSLVWTFPPVEIPYERPYVIQFQSGSLYLPDVNKIPVAEPLDVDLAQATLDVDEKATPSEQAAAFVDVHDYAKALAVLEKGVQDPGGLATWARALAESGGDLGRARTLADQAVAANPASAVGHEAVLRVCVAAHDRPCIVDEWKKLTTAPDFAPRTLVIKDQLEEEARLAACTLNAERDGKPTQTCERLSLKLEPAQEPGSPFQTTAEAPNRPRRSATWTALGGYGFTTLGAGIGAVMGEAFYRGGNSTGRYDDHSKAYRTAVIGAAVGIVPGLLFGNAAREEDNEQGRVVTVLLDVAGSLAVVTALTLVSAQR